MECLPQELVSNILTRLSAKELSKCKCVCKSWLDHITNPHFITNHYVVYNNQEKYHLLVLRIPSFKPYISVFSWNTNEPKGLVSSQILKPPYECDSKYWTEIMGPCNGIFCLRGYQNNVMMNPSLRQFTSLPQSHFTVSDEVDVVEHYGFGFDPKTNDYKLVVLRDIWFDDSHDDEDENDGYLTAELYSLNSNSWRNIDAPPYYPLPCDSRSTSTIYTFVKNCCHWWGVVVDKYGNTGDWVLAFDMVNELFRRIDVPKVEYSLSECYKTLVPVNESDTIGLIVYPRGLLDKCFDVWVMKDYWDERSWIKQYSVGPVPVIYKLVGFYGSNRFLWKDRNKRLVLYEAEN